MFKRILLFGAVNILVVVTISLVLNLLGVRPYLNAGGIDYSMLMAFCLIWGMGGSFISLLLSKFMAKMMMGVEIVDENSSYSDLVSLVHRLARDAGLSKMPEVGVYNSPELNAFATGPSRNNSLVAVSSGLMSRMNRDELEGVLGHEIGHVANGDMVTMTLIQGVINAFVMFFARIVAFFVAQAMRNSNDENRSPSYFVQHMLVFVFEILFGILGMMVVAAFSRWREFRADKAGASLAGSKRMIAALKRLQSNYENIEEGTNQQFSAFKISTKSSWLFLFSTHPPLEERIRALENNL